MSNKPLGFYTSYTPGDGSLLEQLQEQWGAYFEKMTQPDKIYLLCEMTHWLWRNESNPATDEVIKTFDDQICNLPFDDQLGILEALVNQIRYTPSAELPPKD